jgi:hypothetical protein
MWKNLELTWEDTPLHPWNELGSITAAPEDEDEDELYIKGVVIWKKTTLAQFVEKITSLYEATNDYIEDKNIFTGFILTISAVTLFPFHIEVIKDDDVANKFLSLVKREKSQHYILKEELKKSEFGKMKSLKLLISNLVDNNILIDSNDRYIINGKILNGVHIIEND